MKNKIILFMTGCFIVLLSSCLGGDDWESYYEVDKDIQIKTFSLASDSVSALSSVRFTIDQLNCRIMNLDSMDYGTVVKDVICTMTYGSYASQINVLAEATADTVSYSSSDSIDFSKPVKFIIHSGDGVTTRVYTAQINIHQVVPDSMTWNPIKSSFPDISTDEQNVIAFNDNYYLYAHAVNTGGYKLFVSSNLSDWEEQSVNLPTPGMLLNQITTFADNLYIPSSDGMIYKSENGTNWTKIENAPKTIAILGSMDKHTNQNARLSLLVEENNEIKYAVMEDDESFHSGNTISENFPIKGFASQNIYLMYKDRIILAGGITANGELLSSSWSTLDGLSWAEQTDSYGSLLFSKREGASLTYYDDKFYLIGGFDEKGNPLKDIYCSSDYGVTWNYIDELVVLPEDYQARGYASLLVSDDNFITIIGGKTNINGQILKTNWKGRVNHLGFARQ